MNRSDETRLYSGRLAPLAAVAVVLSGLPCGAGTDDSLARGVPAEVGLFAEVRGAGDLLTSLTEPQIWTTLADLAGQPARPEDTARWRERIRRTVKMTPEEAIRVLFARGVAFVGEGPGRAQDAVVLCRPAATTTTEQLLQKWGARRLSTSSKPPTYRLYSNIGVADHDGLLCFGDLLPPEGMFRRMQRFVVDTQPKSLADDPVYKKLLARVPQDPDGVLFARLAQAAPIPVPPVSARTQPATQPTLRPAARNLPGPLRGAENVMVALHREGPLLHLTAVGDANGNKRTPSVSAYHLVEKLPQRTLLAWGGRVDFSELARVVERLPEHNAVRSVFKLQERVDMLEQFFEALDNEACLAVGPVLPGERASGAPPFPAAALLVGARDGSVANHELRNVVDLCVDGYAVFALAGSRPPLPPISETTLHNTAAFVLDLSPLLKPTAKEAIGQVHLCWAVHDDVLIIASHLDWLRQIVAARAGAAGDLSAVMRLSRGKSALSSASAIVAQSGPIADIGALWLGYLRRTKPEVFDEDWWRDRQPGGSNVRLGINVTADLPNRRLRIESVSRNQPADGHLSVGDFIVGHGNRRFVTEDLIAEMSRAIQDRPHARWLDLLVERHGVTRRVRLPLPFFDPLQALQRLIAVGKIAQRAVYHDDHSDPTGPRGFLTIELRTSPDPLFEFSEPVPVGVADQDSR